MKRFLALMLIVILTMIHIPSVIAANINEIVLDEPAINAYGIILVSGTVVDEAGGFVDAEWVTLKMSDGQNVRYIDQKKTNAFGNFTFRCDIDNVIDAEYINIVITDSHGNTADRQLGLTGSGCQLESIVLKDVAVQPIKMDNVFVFNVDDYVDRTSMVAEFTVSDNVAVYVDDVIQTSGVTSNNFEKPINYTVVSQNGTKQEYIVAVINKNSGYVNNEINYDNGVITVSGVVPIKNQHFSVITQNKANNNPVDVIQLTTDAEGKFAHSFVIYGYETIPDSTYNTRVAYGSNDVQTEFEFYNKNSINNMMKEICTASDSYGFVGAVAKYSEILGLDDGIWYEYVKSAGYTDTLKARLYQKMQSGGFASTEAFRISFDEGVLLTTIQCASAPESIYDILMYYSDEFGFSFDESSEYNNVKNKTDVWNKIYKNNYSSIELLDKAISDAVVTTLFNEAARSNIGDLMLRYQEELSFTAYSDYALSQKEYIQKYMLNGEYANISQITAAYNAVAKELNPLNQATGGNASSGGGGGGGSAPKPSNFSIAGDSYTSADISGNMFNDLKDVQWAIEAIESLAKAGIVNGVGEGKFEPDRNISREEFVAMMIRAFGYYDEDAGCSFDDVTENHWAYKYIASAVEKGLINGISEDAFGIGALLSREDMAVIAYRFALASGKTFAHGNENFSDDEQISDYAKEAVAAMKASGIINGTGNDLFSPKSSTTRAMAAKVIYSILK